MHESLAEKKSKQKKALIIFQDNDGLIFDFAGLILSHIYRTLQTVIDLALLMLN